jgi:hypothetical protein
MWRVITARYALSPYIKQIRFVFKGLHAAYEVRTARKEVFFFSNVLYHVLD